MTKVMSQRNYKQEYREYQGTPKQKKNRALRNAARRRLMKEGKVKKGDGMDVDHHKPIVMGGDNSPKNLRILEDNKNRSFARNKNAKMEKAFYGK